MGSLRVLTTGSRSEGSPWFWRLHWRKKIPSNHQNMPYIISDRERAKPFQLSRPLRSCIAVLKALRCLRQGGSLKKKEKTKADNLFAKKPVNFIC